MVTPEQIQELLKIAGTPSYTPPTPAATPIPVPVTDPKIASDMPVKRAAGYTPMTPITPITPITPTAPSASPVPVVPVEPPTPVTLPRGNPDEVYGFTVGEVDPNMGQGEPLPLQMPVTQQQASSGMTPVGPDQPDAALAVIPEDESTPESTAVAPEPVTPTTPEKAPKSKTVAPTDYAGAPGMSYEGLGGAIDSYKKKLTSGADYFEIDNVDLVGGYYDTNFTDILG